MMVGKFTNIISELSKVPTKVDIMKDGVVLKTIELTGTKPVIIDMPEELRFNKCSP